jgi:predicted nucleic acid-binding protein
MNYVLDTNIILIYLKDQETRNFIEENFGPFNDGNNPIISVVTIGEIRSLAKRNKWGGKRIQVVEEFMNELIVVDVRFNDLIDAYAEIDAFSQRKLQDRPLKTSARTMGKNDLWIAATTYVTKSKLITADKDFEHLDGEFFDVILIERK